MRALFAVLVLAISSSAVFAQQVLPEPVGWVNDQAGVITPEYRTKLESLIHELEQKTTAEIAVLTVDTSAGYDAQQYARMIFDRWKPGKKGKDNGVLVLLVVKDRLWRIETGYGLEGILPDGLCGQIGRNYMVPHFLRAEWGAGLYSGVAALANVIAKDSSVDLVNTGSVTTVTTSDKGLPIFLYFFAPLFFFFWNIPWPIFIGLPFTLIFAVAFFSSSPVLGALVIVGYLASQLVRFLYWQKLPKDKRKSFFTTQQYGSTRTDGGFGGSGTFGTGGGFGGGSGGGGGAGGSF
jgi:uncharacterized protein